MEIFILISLIISFPIGIISFFIVNKQIGFIAEGIAHIAFGGLALGLILDISPFFVGAIVAVLSGLLITYLSLKGKVSENLFIGVFLSFSMSIGIILIKLSGKYGVDLFSYLFGSILNITDSHIIYIFIFSISITVLFIIFRKKIAFFIFDPLFLKIKGININLMYYTIVAIISISIIYLIRIMGIIMISGIMIIPGLISFFITSNYKKEVLFSISISFLMLISGIYLSYIYSFLPPGPTIIIVGVIFLLLSFIFKKRK
ncbi:MAG TPA: metal ABC transporter permease [Spirochaetota bacterium]|nr:metal ABC transporter permease [Spirochaetota bacterium]HOM38504.1 metal ABC transporter permease [Spirochaetota bacterium]HPQ49044.1 metal ABC transporter permease [Spirochaetota bacterium]